MLGDVIVTVGEVVSVVVVLMRVSARPTLTFHPDVRGEGTVTVPVLVIAPLPI